MPTKPCKKTACYKLPPGPLRRSGIYQSITKEHTNGLIDLDSDLQKKINHSYFGEKMAELTLPKKPWESIEDQIIFKTLRRRDKKLLNLLEGYFLEIIQPLYGDQSEFLKKIKEGKDRICEFLIYSEKAAGVAIYKNHTSNEFIDFGIENAIEIKTVFLFEKNKKTAGLFLRHLLSRPAQMAIDIDATCLFGTVSSKKPEILRMMCKLGFKIIETFQGKYIKGIDEYLICHPRPEDLLIRHNLQEHVCTRGLTLCQIT